MVNFVINLKWGDPHILLELFLFDFVAILNWILSNQINFHLFMIIIHSKACIVASQLNHQWNYFIGEAPSNPLLNLLFKIKKSNFQK